MSLSRDEVEKVSLLGRLRLTEQEVETMTSQLGQVLNYFQMLSEVDTTGVEPMAHAIDVSNVFREDVVTESLPRNIALANAPKHDGEYYHVPAVLGE